MREIKFRARWRDTLKKVIDFNDEYTIAACEDDAFIVEQFTGLKDKNGVDIYEGDIIKGVNGSINCVDWVFEPYVIKWNNEECKFNVPLWGTLNNQDSTHWFEIIGNIHEHKHLLK